MIAAPRIAVLWATTAPRDGVDAALASHPRAAVEVFTDLLADADAIVRSRPDVLLFAHDTPGPEEAGALLLLRALLPRALFIVAAPAAAAAAHTLAARLQGASLELPAPAGGLAAILDAALGEGPDPDREALLTLTQGIADEVNNPLQVALGHLRLLEEDFTADAPQQPKLAAIRRSLQRIRTTLARAQLVQRAHRRGGERAAVDLTALFAEFAPDVAAPRTTVQGDADLLRHALRELAAVGRDIATAGHPPQFSLVAGDERITVRLDLPAVKLADWQLPRTFEPYYLGNLLRGTSHGLGLFTVAVIARAHAGRTAARRRPDGGLTLEFELPAG